MKTITSNQIKEAVSQALLAAHFDIAEEINSAIQNAITIENSSCAKNVLNQICENYQIATREQIPICQDSGMTVIFAEVGQDVHITGDFEAAVNAGVRQAHKEGYLRASVVRDPLLYRQNTGDGTPAVIHTRLIPGEDLRLTVMAKGFGSENCSQMRLFVPAAPLTEIKAFIVDAVTSAGAKSCPPIIAGVGIGGTIEKASQMAKWALGRGLSQRNPDPGYARLEAELLEKINHSGIGPGGLGGKTTALAVNIEVFPTHIASIPVVVNLCCHASRHKHVVL